MYDTNGKWLNGHETFMQSVGIVARRNNDKQAKYKYRSLILNPTKYH